MVFPVVIYGCESWSIKKAERRRIYAFELWCWRRILRVAWTARRSTQSILKEISPGCSLEALMMKLKLQYFGHLMWRANSLEKTLMLRKIEDGRRRGWQRMRWLDGITDSMNMSLGSWFWTGRLGVLRFMGSQRVRHDWRTELNWADAWSVNMARQGCIEAESTSSLSFIWIFTTSSYKLVSVWFGFASLLLSFNLFSNLNMPFLSNTLSLLPLSCRVRINPIVLPKRLFMNFP